MAKILPSPSSDMGTNADIATWCYTAAVLKLTQEKEDKFYPALQIPCSASSALGLKVYFSFCLPLITMTDPPKWRTLNPQSPTPEWAREKNSAIAQHRKLPPRSPAPPCKSARLLLCPQAIHWEMGTLGETHFHHSIVSPPTAALGMCPSAQPKAKSMQHARARPSC